MIALHLRQLLTASPAMIIKHLLVLACTTAVATMASAQSAATDPVGFTTAGAARRIGLGDLAAVR
jgi:hypothetical protein